ncbi:MAG: alpha/beta fold hydrolase [Tetrasphaera sp.]
MSLFTLSHGSAGERIAFLHGLFGQGRNWMQIAKALAGPDGDQARCLLIDLPDHGRSPRSDRFSYPAYADAIGRTLADWSGGEPVTLAGHSLGGKVAMLSALAHPDRIGKLAVVDIAPKSYGSLAHFDGYIAGMRMLRLDDLATRAEADARFAEVEPDQSIRAFLLQNLRRSSNGWRWQANLDLIAADAARGDRSRIADFPVAAGDYPAYEGKVVWIAGGESRYIKPEDSATMRALFPQVRKVTIKGAGHWVHTDAPEVVVETLTRLLQA